MQYTYRSKYLVIRDGDVYVYKYDKCKFDQTFLCFKPKHTFIGKSKVCPMTQFSGANDSSGFDGKTFLLECENNEYVYISGLKTFKFKTDDKIIDYISLMGNNMIPFAIIIGEKFTYFIAHHYKVIENDRIEEGTLLNSTNGYPYDYHLDKCGVFSFKKLGRSLIQTCWPAHGENEENEDDISDEEDEVEENEDLIGTQYLNGNDEVVKNFNQKCVICYERESVNAFRECGHQCTCEQCYQNKSGNIILKCVVCRTYLMTSSLFVL